MREVFSAVIVIGIVLVAVFVPVAFFPGTTGRMYQQFSLTIAFAVVLSVFNAVTFTPALSALLLDKQSHAAGPVLHVRSTASSTAARTSTCASSARLLRLASWRCWLLFVARRSSATWLVYRVVPSSFVPDEDEGYFIAIIQAPAGASLEYTIEHRASRPSDHHEAAGSAGGVLGRRLQLQRVGAEPGPDVRAAEAVRRAATDRTSRSRRCSTACAGS